MDPQPLSRRELLEFFGVSLAGAAAASLLGGCASASHPEWPAPAFLPLKKSNTDTLNLTEGLRYQIVLKWGDPISKTEKFGSHNDYIAYIPLVDGNPNEGLLWVNHEYVDPLFACGLSEGSDILQRHIDIQRKEVGGSIVHLKKSDAGWVVVTDSPFNKRIDGTTPIPIIAEKQVFGSNLAIGTLGNCAGGVTPWKTVLTCEENYFHFYGEVSFEGGKRQVKDGESDGHLYWSKFYPQPPEHYGWVVEVDPRSGQAKKLTALGRFAHECATTTLAADGRCVVYMGDDAANEHVYKFISAKPGSLEKGELFVADTVKGKWLPLSRERDPRLKKAFKSHTELLIRTREAAKIVNATPLDRPEDVEIDHKTKAVYVSCTNNKKTGNLFGSIMKIEEAGADPLALEFKASTFLAGGPRTGFACPDNLVFDKKGNLWMSCDVSDTNLNTGPYAPFGNNALFFIPMSGLYAGNPIRIATAPVNAEFTGPCFSPDGKTLFLSVQHPGEGSKSLSESLSHWPDGGETVPRSSVIAISGPALDKLIG